MQYLTSLFDAITLTTLATIPAAPQDRDVITVPFTLNDQNNIVVASIINGSDSLNLMFHTAASDVTLTEDGVRKSKTIKFTGSTKVKSWGGESDSRWSKGNRIQIGRVQRKNITIWENQNSGKDTDGKFGLDFFQNRVVEIDFDLRRMVVHKSLPRKVKEYVRLKIENQDGQLMILATCAIDGTSYTNKFLVHSGYSGGILLDDAFAARTGVDGKIKITNESNLKDSFGNTIKVKKGVMPEFILGTAKVSNIPIGFFAGGVGTQKVSVIGMEVLRQFNLVFDIAKNDLYVSPRRA